MGSKFPLSFINRKYLGFAFMLDSLAHIELQVQNNPEVLRILFLFCTLEMSPGCLFIVFCVLLGGSFL